MKAGEHAVIMWAVIPKDKYHKVHLPDGCFAKAFHIGEIQQLVQKQECMHWASIMAVALQKLAVKLCPEIAESPIIRIDKGFEI
jgi:hypothetical protein